MALVLDNAEEEKEACVGDDDDDECERKGRAERFLRAPAQAEAATRMTTTTMTI